MCLLKLGLTGYGSLAELSAGESPAGNALFCYVLNSRMCIIADEIRIRYTQMRVCLTFICKGLFL